MSKENLGNGKRKAEATVRIVQRRDMGMGVDLGSLQGAKKRREGHQTSTEHGVQFFEQ